MGFWWEKIDLSFCEVVLFVEGVVEDGLVLMIGVELCLKLLIWDCIGVGWGKLFIGWILKDMFLLMRIELLLFIDLKLMGVWKIKEWFIYMLSLLKLLGIGWMLKWVWCNFLKIVCLIEV